MNLNWAKSPIKRRLPATDWEILRTFLQDVIELTARTELAAAEFEVITRQISTRPPRPDEAERWNNASLKLATARNELTNAYRRMDEHIGGGILEAQD